MKFKIGDIVIKKTGGNKMTISNILSDKYECVWFDDTKLYTELFDEGNIVSLEEFKILLKKEERDDKIKKLLK